MKSVICDILHTQHDFLAYFIFYPLAEISISIFHARSQRRHQLQQQQNP